MTGRPGARPQPPHPPVTDDYPRAPLRRRLLVLLLAVATAAAVLLALIYRPGDPKRGQPFATQSNCPDGKGSGCVGGRSELILVAPAASAASR